jgi:anti-sigma factor RsiW
MTCKELVEVVTDYLEGRLPDATLAQLEEHLAACDGCTLYVEQMKLTLRTLGQIPEETVTPAAREALIAVFRELHPQAV